MPGFNIFSDKKSFNIIGYFLNLNMNTLYIFQEMFPLHLTLKTHPLQRLLQNLKEKKLKFLAKLKVKMNAAKLKRH